MMRPAGVLLLALFSSTSPAAPPALPAVEAQASLRPPNPHRLRITVTESGISVRLARGEADKQVVALKSWAVAGSALQGNLIVPLAAALEPAPQDDALPDRFFSTAVDGWAELWVDRRAPFGLVVQVLSTAGQQVSKVALGVKAPGGEQTVELLLPQLGLPSMTNELAIAIERDQLRIAVSGTERKAKRNLATLRSAVSSFEKAQARGRVPERPSPLGDWVCMDDRGQSLDAKACWHGHVILAADPALSWGEVLPLVAAAQTIIPDVLLGSL